MLAVDAHKILVLMVYNGLLSRVIEECRYICATLRPRSSTDRHSLHSQEVFCVFESNNDLVRLKPYDDF